MGTRHVAGFVALLASALGLIACGGGADTSGAQETVGAVPGAEKRAEARKRLEQKRNLQGGLIAYVVINAFLIGVWATTGAGYFWPLDPRRVGRGDAPRRLDLLPWPDHGCGHR